MISKVLVAQMGPRMHYAVPRMICAAGRLESYYTDICAARGWLARARRWVPRSWRFGLLDQLLERYPADIPSTQIVHFPGFGLEYARRRYRAKTPAETIGIHVWAGRRFCELVIRNGLGHAAAIYTFNSAGLELLRYARDRGVFGIHEQTIAPRSLELRLMVEEAERFPGWSAEAIRLEPEIQEMIDRERAEWDAADLIVCGSEFVSEGIAREKGPAGKTVVVPYGVTFGSHNERPRTEHAGPLRVLFAGTVGLRKGIGDVASAGALLGRQTVRVRAVGSVALTDQGRRAVERGVELLGRVPRTEMAAEYANADVFLLPSICEGSATVIYEALACGLPVITTPNAGSVVRDGVEGFVVPIRSPERIAEKLNVLAEKRALRRDMSENARKRAMEFTLECYGDRLLRALDGLLQGRKGCAHVIDGSGRTALG